MTTIHSTLAHLSDDELLIEVRRLSELERQATAHLIASLVELDARRLYFAQGCSSLFTYCTQILRLSEHAAYGRIEAARAARRFPVVLELLADGAITLTGVGLLAPHLTPENHRELLNSARHKSKREVEYLVACLRPQPAVPSIVRKLPTPKPPETLSVDRGPTQSDAPAPPSVAPPPNRPAVLGPLAPDRYKVQLTVSRETYEKLRRAQDLLRHTIPNVDAAAIFDRALSLLVADLEKKKLAATERPRPASASSLKSRHISAAVRRKVWARDGGQCAFVGTNGRCTERGFIEFHHVVPYAGGGATTVENLELRCRGHNAYEAERWFGPLLVRETAPLWGRTRSRPSPAGVSRFHPAVQGTLFRRPTSCTLRRAKSATIEPRPGWRNWQTLGT